MMEPTPPSNSGTNTSNPTQKGDKWTFVVVIVVVVVLVAGAVLLLMKSKSPKSHSSTAAVSKSQTSGPVKTETLAASNTYTSKSGNFSFTKPAGWKPSEDGELPSMQGAEGVLYVPEQGDSAQTSTLLVYGIELPPGSSLSGSIEAGKKAFEAFPGYQLIDDQTFKRDGNEGVYTEVKYKLGDLMIRQSQLAITKGNKLYVVTATLPDDKWAANQQVIKTLNDSLEVK